MPDNKVSDYKIRAFGMTDIGLVRNQNEDNYLVDNEHLIYAVADGLGGLPDGELASEVAVKKLEEVIQSGDLNGEWIPYSETFQTLHQAVCEEGEKVDEDFGIGTTLTCAQFREDKIHIGHVGDTGIILFRGGRYRMLTIDHTMAQEMLDSMDENDDKESIPEYFHHTLTRCLGQQGDIETDVYDFFVRPGDKILIYSDGVTKTWKLNEIQAGFNMHNDPETFVRQIIEVANQRGGPDNITAIALFVEE